MREVDEVSFEAFEQEFAWQEAAEVRRLADRFGHAASTCPSLTELRILIAGAADELGFAYFALLHHASLTTPSGPFLRIDNYPPDWVGELAADGLARHDPVHLASRRTNAGFVWAGLHALVRLGREQKLILKRSRRFGLGPGLTVPVNVPGEPAGSCSFAMRQGQELPGDRLLCAELVGAHAFGAARRLAGLQRTKERPHLSRRELECLRLVAIGKTDWEIGRILGISTETARQYVKRARAAYRVVSRTQLVVLGLRDDWLSFEEAAAPPG